MALSFPQGGGFCQYENSTEIARQLHGLSLSHLRIQRPETAVAVSQERAHTNLFGHGKGLVVVGCSFLNVWRLTTHGNVAEETVRMRLVATSCMGAGEVEAAVCARRLFHTT